MKRFEPVVTEKEKFACHDQSIILTHSGIFELLDI